MGTLNERIDAAIERVRSELCAQLAEQDGIIESLGADLAALDSYASRQAVQLAERDAEIARLREEIATEKEAGELATAFNGLAEFRAHVARLTAALGVIGHKAGSHTILTERVGDVTDPGFAGILAVALIALAPTPTDTLASVRALVDACSVDARGMDIPTLLRDLAQYMSDHGAHGENLWIAAREAADAIDAALAGIAWAGGEL